MAELQMPLSLLGSLLFMMIGPISLIPRFAQATASQDTAERRKVAIQAALIAAIALVLAVLLGVGAMSRFGTSASSLIIAAGLILTLTSLCNGLGLSSSGSKNVTQDRKSASGMQIAIPGIVTPMGVAVVIIFVSYFPAWGEKLTIMAIVFAIIALNLLAMFAATWFMKRIGLAPLQVLGAVFNVLQTAMGIEMIVSGLLRSALLR